MKDKYLCETFLGIALVAIALAACDATPPRDAALHPPPESEEITPGETLTDLVRNALTDVLEDEDAYSRARRLGTLLPTLGPELVPAVKEVLNSRILDYRAPELDLLLRYWASHEPEEASLWAKTKSPPDYRAAAVFSAVYAWAEADGKDATDAAWGWWVDVPILERILPVALVRGWYAANDPPELGQWMRELSPGIPRQRAIAAYIRVVLETQGAAAVMRWAESLPDGSDHDATFKRTAFGRVTSLLSQLDVESALRWCETHCDTPAGKNMREIIARNWVVSDGPAAMAWLSSAPPGKVRDFAVRFSFATWGSRDREAALAWMASQTTAGELEPWLRPVVPVYARLLVAEAPREAIQWAQRIEDEREREVVTIRVAQAWRQLDEAAAEEWLLQSPLSEQARQQARVPLRPRPGAIPQPRG